MSSPVITTQRLELFQFDPRDAAEFFALNDDPEVLRYTGDPPFADEDEARQFLESYDQYRLHGMGRWTMKTRDAGEYVGWCGLKQHSDFVDLGYRLKRTWWGKGLASEAAEACLAYGFESLGIDAVVGRALVANSASIRVLEKIGLKHWKRELTSGFGDTVFYRLTRDEYFSAC